MSAAVYFTRFFAMLVVAAVLIGAVLKPSALTNVLPTLADKAEDAQERRANLSEKACPLAGAPLGGAFADVDDVLSISPLGGVTAPQEPLPAPYIRINTKFGDTVFERRTTSALSPARAEVTAIERRIRRDDDGKAVSQSWTVFFRVCEDISLYYDDLDTINPDLMRRVGGIAAFQQIDGPDHSAATTSLRVNQGDIIGAGDGFDVGLEDAKARPVDLVRPERYRHNPYLLASATGADASLLEAVGRDHARAQCPLDYLPEKVTTAWSALLGDAVGVRRAKGGSACRTALVDAPGTAQGAWFTDAAHNGATSKVSAVALAPDNIDPTRLIFALHGKLTSLKPSMVSLHPKLTEAREAAARDFLTFERGVDRRNAAFTEVKAGSVYCYDRLRANFVGPLINGVLLLELTENEGLNSVAAPEGASPNGAPRGGLMKIEMRGDVQACVDLETPWAFTGAETTFYR